MKNTLFLTILIFLVCPVMLANEPNEVDALKTKISKLEAEIEKQKHTILVAQKNIKKLQDENKEIAESDKQNKIIIRAIKDSVPVLNTESKKPFSINSVYYIKRVKVTQIISDKQFFADLPVPIYYTDKGSPIYSVQSNGRIVEVPKYYRIYIQNINIPKDIVDGQDYHLNQPMRIVDRKKYETVVGGTNTVFVFEPVEWSDVTFVKRK